MKKRLTLILLFFNILSGISQLNILNEVIKIDPTGGINILCDSESYLSTFEMYEGGELTKKYTQESFYNYDTLKVCFMTDRLAPVVVDTRCELKTISKNLQIQTCYYYQYDEYTKKTTYIHRNNEQIDSIIILDDGLFDRSLKLTYNNDLLIEKNYNSESFGKSKTTFVYDENQLTIESIRGDTLTGKTIYTVQDSSVMVNTYDSKNIPIQKKLFIIIADDEQRIIEKRQYEFSKDGDKKLIRQTKYSYWRDEIKIIEENLKSQIKIKTLIDDGDKTIETHWLKDNKKRIIRYLSL